MVEFTFFAILAPRINVVNDFLNLSNWQNAAAGVGVLSIPVALVGSIATIILAKNALQVSENQEHMQALAVTLPIMLSVEDYLWRRAKDIDDLWSAAISLMSVTWLNGATLGDLNVKSKTDAKRLFEETSEAIMKNEGKTFNEALLRLQATNLEAGKSLILMDIIRGSFDRLLSDTTDCLLIKNQAPELRDNTLDGLRIGELIEEVRQDNVAYALAMLADRSILFPGFGYPFGINARVPSEPEIVPFIRLLLAILGGCHRQYVLGAQIMFELPEMTGSAEVARDVVIAYTKQLGLLSPRIDFAIKQRFLSVSPSRYLHNLLIGLNRMARKNGNRGPAWKIVKDEHSVH